MKKMLWLLGLLVLILNINSNNNVQSAFIEKVNFNLKPNEIAITFINDDNNQYFLISNNNRDMLLILNYYYLKNNKLLYKFNLRHLKIMTLKEETITNLQYEEKIILDDSYYLDQTRYMMMKNLLQIEYNDSLFCVYLGNNFQESELAECNFIYFFKVNNLPHIDISDNTDIVFYHYKKVLPSNLLNDIYNKWIDTYTIKNNEYTIVTLTENDYYITVAYDD